MWRLRQLGGIALILGVCLLGCVLVAVAMELPGDDAELSVALAPVPGAQASGRALQRSDRVVLSGAADEVRVRLRVDLPATGAGDTAWLLWLDRDLLDEVRIEAPGWRSPPQGFFAPTPEQGPMPAGFAFRLPRDWSGPLALDLVLRGSAPATLRPRVLREAQAALIQQRIVAMASALYVSLGLLALIGLSLYLVVRDRAYLALLAFAATGLATLLAINGHLYALPGLRYFALWGVQGVWAVMLMAAAAAIWIAQHYADFPLHWPRLQRQTSAIAVAILALAALCLLNLTLLLVPMRWLSSLGWMAAASVGLLAGVLAVRRRAWISVPILLMIVLLVFAAGMRELSLHGLGGGGFWVRYGFQLGLAGAAFLLSMGLIGRIALVRAERDRERLARDDSERRFEREAARAELEQTLQKRLRELPPGDMEWAAFRAVIERLQPLLRLESGALVAYGYHGFDLLLAEPLHSKEHFTGLVAQRLGMMKGLARTQAPLQLQLEDTEGHGAAGGQRLHAVVPLPIKSPAWGVLLLRRGDGSGFSHDELALAAEFGRLAVHHSDEAALALNLRRSAELDSLTGALNRRTIDLWLARSFTDSHRSEQPLSVLFVDIDHFKSINDTYGHACGDRCLRHVSETLRRELEASDLLGRYGGEEFLLVLPGRNGDTARQLGERIRAAVERSEFDYDGKSIRLTVSIGVAPRLPPEHSPGAAVERADKALYTAKRSGRNRVSVAPAVFS